MDKKYGYVKIMLDDHLGGGLNYQLNHLRQEAQRIGLKVEFIEMELSEEKQ